jgi:hypothetical protein
MARATEPMLWDAQAEWDIAVMIRRYLAEHPSPRGSDLARELKLCADDLKDASRRHLSQLGARPLRSVPARASSARRTTRPKGA